MKPERPAFHFLCLPGVQAAPARGPHGQMGLWPLWEALWAPPRPRELPEPGLGGQQPRLKAGTGRSTCESPAVTPGRHRPRREVGGGAVAPSCRHGQAGNRDGPGPEPTVLVWPWWRCLGLRGAPGGAQPCCLEAAPTALSSGEMVGKPPREARSRARAGAPAEDSQGHRGDSLVPASCHPGPEVWKQHGGGDPFSHHRSEEARLAAPARPRSSTSAEARTQPNPKNAHGERTGLTGQRSPGAPALDGGTKPHQARTTPRHRQETEAGGRRRKSLSVQLQDTKEGGPAAFFFFLFLS